MKIIDFMQYKNVYFFGDPHGINIIYDILRSYVNEDNISDNSVIFSCGDNGIGFYDIKTDSNKLKLCNDICIKHNIQLILIRGNHDNPDLYNESSPLNKSNISLVDDFTVVKTGDYNIICIGGAISIDRTNRVLNKTYWKNEGTRILDDELKEEIKSLDFNIDIVCSHNCPTYQKPRDEYPVLISDNPLFNWSIWDSKLLDDNFIDRSNLDAIHEELSMSNKIKYWIYGHFHNHYVSIENKPKFICLDMYYKNIKILKKTNNSLIYKTGPDILDIHNINKFNQIKIKEI